MLGDKNLNVPYISSKPGNCGIACAMMLLEYYGIEIKDRDEFIKKYKTRENYIDPTGWTHKGLVNILKSNGVNAKSCKVKSLNFILQKVHQNKPVIVSLRTPGPDNVSQEKMFEPIKREKPLEGHLCVIKGIKSSNVILHDPRNNGIYSKDLEVPVDIFERVFSGNCIV